MTEPPRQYSIGRPDYDPEAGRRLAIYVDGAEQQHVIAYDCQAGTVLKNKTDADGRVILNDAKDEVVRETVRGDVIVKWRSK